MLALLKCNLCNGNFMSSEIVHTHRHSGELVELGYDCPRCDGWHHLGWLNSELMERQKILKNNRQKRAFRRDFKKFQEAQNGTNN